MINFNSLPIPHHIENELRARFGDGLNINHLVQYLFEKEIQRQDEKKSKSSDSLVRLQKENTNLKTFVEKVRFWYSKVGHYEGIDKALKQLDERLQEMEDNA